MMPYSFKDTGESYEQFLARNRSLETKAKGHLPENKHIAKEIAMADLYKATLTDVKSRSFAEIDVNTLHGYEEVKSFYDDGLRVVEYKRIGTPLVLCVCEDAGAYWFTEEDN